jgi:hypothetical protein
MTPLEIETLFNVEIKKRGLASKIPNVTTNQLYDWRHKRSEVTLGIMLEVLLALNKIKIQPNNGK